MEYVMDIIIYIKIKEYIMIYNINKNNIFRFKNFFLFSVMILGFGWTEEPSKMKNPQQIIKEHLIFLLFVQIYMNN